MSACQNCHLFIDQCKAMCCGVVPIKKEVYEANKDKIQRPLSDMKEAQIPGHVIPYTPDGKCVFLNANNRCEIYGDRPWLCVQFGNEEHPTLTCFWQRKNGTARPKKEAQKMAEKAEKRAMKYLRIKSEES